MIKQFNVMASLGKARHVVNFHDGVKTHVDGSPFRDIRVFRNKVDRDKFISELKTKGYLER